MRTKTRNIRLVSLLLALILALGLAGCGQRPQDEESVSESSSGFEFSNPLSSEFEPPEDPLEHPGFLEEIAERDEVNSDVVGYLYVPNTEVDDVVVWYPNDPNEYYLRRSWDRSYSQEGCYYADFRNTFEGDADSLSRNTVIYGHSLDLNDDPNAPYFSQLKKFFDQDFAEENPYLYFSTEEEDLVWEIFAVFFATTDLDYNNPDPTNEAFASLIQEVEQRSLYNYDIDVGANDKIITLSTCTYLFTRQYPNKYRYVVMAKLVDKETANKVTADMVANPDPKESPL